MDWSTLVYDKKLIDNIKMIIKGRDDIKAPVVSIGIDGGKRKVCDRVDGILSV